MPGDCPIPPLIGNAIHASRPSPCYGPARMFTGIVTDIGRVRSLAPAGQGRDTRLVIDTAYDTGAVEIGASIACSRLLPDRGRQGRRLVRRRCLGRDAVARPRSAPGRPGAAINLERAAASSATSSAGISSAAMSTAWRASLRGSRRAAARASCIELGDGFGRFIAPKGSVALDGVSLTVNEVEDGGALTRFGVNIIPHTLTATTFGDLKPGDAVNLEVDMLARYVARLEERN